MKKVIIPQPERINEMWWYNDAPYTDDSMASHLFHDVWGNDLDNLDGVPDNADVEAVLHDDKWYWSYELGG